MTENSKVDTAFRFVKNAESLLVAVILAAILWLGSTIFDNSLVLSKLTQSVEQMLEQQANINDVNRRVMDASLKQITTAVNVLEERFSRLYPRLREIKERVQSVEGTMGNAKGAVPWNY